MKDAPYLYPVRTDNRPPYDGYKGDLDAVALRMATIELFKHNASHPMDTCEAIIKAYIEHYGKEQSSRESGENK